MHGKKRLLSHGKDYLVIEYYGWSRKVELKLSEPHFMELIEQDIVRVMSEYLKHHEGQRHYKPHPKERGHGETKFLSFKIGPLFKRIEIGNFKIKIARNNPWYKDNYQRLTIVFTVFLNPKTDDFPTIDEFKQLWGRYIKNDFGSIF